MTRRCFASRQLYALRNDIDVRQLIERTLRIPCRVDEGRFRFLCPVCRMFDTAVNPKTNLARCFRCSRNFNTIDLVMIIRRTDFVQSVEFLQSVHQAYQHHSASEAGTSPGARATSSGLCHIGKILDGVLPPAHTVVSEKPTDKDRIARLEQKLEHLSRQIENLTRTIDNRPTSR